MDEIGQLKQGAPDGVESISSFLLLWTNPYMNLFARGLSRFIVSQTKYADSIGSETDCVDLIK